MVWFRCECGLRAGAVRAAEDSIHEGEVESADEITLGFRGFVEWTVCQCDRVARFAWFVSDGAERAQDSRSRGWAIGLIAEAVTGFGGDAVCRDGGGLASTSGLDYRLDEDPAEYAELAGR